MGGAAAASLGSTRGTRDIDLCIAPNARFNAATLSDHLKKMPNFKEVDEHKIGHMSPAVVLPGHSDPVVVEIFDTAWHDRPQYKDVTTKTTHVRIGNGLEVVVFSPAWQLREKIAALKERAPPGHPKAVSDIADIIFLCTKIPQGERKKDLLHFTDPQYVNAYRALLQRPDVKADSELRRELPAIIQV